MKRIRHTKIDKPTATAATHHLTAAAATSSSTGSGVMGGHSAQVAAAQAAAMFVNPLGLSPHQLSSLQGSLSALGGASSQMAHHHMAAMAAASAAMQGEVNCPCCRKRLPDRVSRPLTLSDKTLVVESKKFSCKLLFNFTKRCPL